MYIIVAMNLVFLHMLFTWEYGPDKKHVPHKDTIEPNVKHTANGVGLPFSKDVKRKKEPKERRKPMQAQERQP
jgi:hypothetical protein